MTDPRSESNPADPSQAESVQEIEQLTRMLTDLADDPDAPASTVTARSVLDSVRAAAADAAPQPDQVGAELPAAAADALPASVGGLHLLAVRAEAARTKAARRRTTLFSLAAAAAVAAVAAVVIPLAVSSNSTTTSANSAKDAAPAAAAESAAAQPAPGTPVESPAAAGDAAAGAAPAPESGGEAAAAPELGTGSEQERPPPGDRAATSVLPTDAPQPTDTADQTCWPVLPAAATAALTATLPADAFQAPAALTAACGSDPVAGAELTGTAPGTSLEVRVSKAESGRCARGNSEAGVRCVPRGDGVYVATAIGGSATAYVYGNGNEVTVGAPSNNGLAPPSTGLTEDQTIAAAQAVLGALG